MLRNLLMSVSICLGWTATPAVVAGGEFKATGFFRVEQVEGVWWFITPGGDRFISAGVNHVSFTADHAPALGYAPYARATAAKYGNEEKWAGATVDRLKSWGFNTIGGWSSSHACQREIAYTPILNLGVRAGGDWLRGTFPDVFSVRFQESVEATVQAECLPRRDDPWLLGYFTDNELKWGPDWRSATGLLAGYWALPANSAGREKAVRVLRDHYNNNFARFAAVWKPRASSWEEVVRTARLDQVSPLVTESQQRLRQNMLLGMVPKQVVIGYLLLQYGTIDRFNDADVPELGKQAGTTFKSFAEVATPQPLSPFDEELAAIETQFTSLVAAQYFHVCSTTIRKVDPNHLILGCRFAMKAPKEVAISMRDHVDVVSLNFYDAHAPQQHGREIYQWTGKPLLISEFGFKAMDSGLPNSKGAGLPVATQQDRADSSARYVQGLMAMPFVVGFHWFEHADEPAEGRFDGENCNYGLVNIKDEPWEVLTARMRDVNARLLKLHEQP
jgi:agarase